MFTNLNGSRANSKNLKACQFFALQPNIFHQIFIIGRVLSSLDSHNSFIFIHKMRTNFVVFVLSKRSRICYTTDTLRLNYLNFIRRIRRFNRVVRGIIGITSILMCCVKVCKSIAVQTNNCAAFVCQHLIFKWVNSRIFQQKQSQCSQYTQ